MRPQPDRRSPGGVAVRLLAALTGCAGLVLLGIGLVRIVHFERTADAVRDEASGRALVLLGCLLLLASAGSARTAPLWSRLAIAAPVLVCGGLVVTAGGSLLPQLAALVAVPLAVVGLTAAAVLGEP